MSSETHDIGPAEVNTQKIALIGVGGALATFFFIALAQFFFYFVRERIDQGKGNAAPVQQAVERVAAQKGKLVESGRWIKQDEGRAAVPVELAMELALAGKRAKAPPAPAAGAPTAPMPQAKPGANAKQ